LFIASNALFAKLISLRLRGLPPVTESGRIGDQRTIEAIDTSLVSQSRFLKIRRSVEHRSGTRFPRGDPAIA
jgi:hypothetical protein